MIEPDGSEAVPSDTLITEKGPDGDVSTALDYQPIQGSGTPVVRDELSAGIADV